MLNGTEGQEENEAGARPRGGGGGQGGGRLRAEWHRGLGGDSQSAFLTCMVKFP